MKSQRILLIEDEVELAELVTFHLKDWGADVTVSHDGRLGLEQARTGQFDAVILDWMLPGMDGLDVLRHIRGHAPALPVLMLTARASEIDRVLGLEVGADDYLTKPFSPRELVARVKALLRRVEALAERREDTGESRLAVGELRLDTERREARLGPQTLSLTAKEFDLLAQFARHPGRVYTRAELLDLVWGYGHEGYEHTVNSHINRLRAKLEEDPGQPKRLLTVWGVGYKLADGVQALQALEAQG
ncbi:MAG: response regulator transcription factor [Acidobacteriota bacterium]